MRWIEDPGHAWLEVDKAKVIASGADISHFSYQDSTTGKAYLEEDCDAGAFLHAIGHDGKGIPDEFQSLTFIRFLPSYSA